MTDIFDKSSFTSHFLGDVVKDVLILSFVSSAWRISFETRTRRNCLSFIRGQRFLGSTSNWVRVLMPLHLPTKRSVENSSRYVSSGRLAGGRLQFSREITLFVALDCRGDFFNISLGRNNVNAHETFVIVAFVASGFVVALNQDLLTSRAQRARSAVLYLA